MFFLGVPAIFFLTPLRSPSFSSPTPLSKRLLPGLLRLVFHLLDPTLEAAHLKQIHGVSFGKRSEQRGHLCMDMTWDLNGFISEI